MSHVYFFRSLGWSLALLVFFTSLAPAKEKDYRAKAHQAAAEITYLEQDQTIRRALAIGRSTGAISQKDVDTIVDRLEKKKEIPATLLNTWQKLLRMSQTQTYLYDSKYFFPVGYEFETIHPGHVSSDEFKKGSKKFQGLLDETIGLKKAKTKSEEAEMTDRAGRVWKLVQENVTPEAMEPDGYEFVSPPIRDPGEVQDVGQMAWRLGEKKYGQSNNMTGGHQTFTIVPNGEKADEKIMGRMAANLQLLQAQYAPALYEILDIRRDGGVPGANGPFNFFMRPIVLDHQELIESMSKLDPEKVTLKDVRKLFFDKHVDKEYERTLLVRRDVQEIIDHEEFDEAMKASHKERGELEKLWKYRDMQIKYNLKDPASTLMETRIGDWVHDRPEQTMLKTLVYENLIAKAWDLSKEGKIFQPDIPKRKAGESDQAYWKRMQDNPAASKENFLKTVGITDENKANMILGKAFQVKDPGFRASSRPSYGFEIEGWTDDLVDLIVPNDPELRVEWDSLSRKKRLNLLEKKGITLGEYSETASRRLGTEFRVDTAKYPYMSPDIIMEDSGNWEIMSHGRGIEDRETLEKSIKALSKKIPDEQFGLHIHRFTPDEMLEFVKKNPKKYAKFLERQSLAITLQGYAEAGTSEPHHAYDSWSLDRYSPAEIEKIESHLAGTGEIKSSELKGLKYHNMAYRPVRGGIDNEMRDIGGDVDFGLKHIDAISNAIDTGNFGPEGAEKSSSLFMEFRDHADPFGKETKRYTLVDAVEKNHKLTGPQRDLLKKFQFEVYKPHMSNYMYFINPETPNSALWDTNEIPAKYLDPKMARANFENNMALPLLDYDGQKYLTQADKKALAQGREAFAENIYKIMQQVEKDPRYKFLLEDDNFLYLCDYLKRSEHPDAKGIKFAKVSAKEAEKRRELLEELTFKLRGESVRFVRDTKAHEMIQKSLPKAIPAGSKGCPTIYKALIAG